MSASTSPGPLRKPWVRTPLIESAALSELAGCLDDHSYLGNTARDQSGLETQQQQLYDSSAPILTQRSRVLLKLDNLQPSGSFKSRGIGNFIRHTIATYPSGTPLHFFSLSGGNAGLACVHAAVKLGQKATVVVPLTTKPEMIQKLIAAGASNVLQRGASLKEAKQFLDEYLRVKAEDSSDDEVSVFVTPYDHKNIWAGNGTLAWEIAEQLAELEGVDIPTIAGSKPILPTMPVSRITDPVDLSAPSTRTVAAAAALSAHKLPAAIICSVGGGGLLNGIVEGLTGIDSAVSNCGAGIANQWSQVPIIATETIGADSLAASIRAWASRRSVFDEITAPIGLDQITSAATSLGVAQVSSRTFDLVTAGLRDSLHHYRCVAPSPTSMPTSSLEIPAASHSLSSASSSVLSTSTAASRPQTPKTPNTEASSPILPSILSSDYSSDYSSSYLSEEKTTFTFPTTVVSSVSERLSNPVIPVVISDDDAARGSVALADSDRLLVELACGVNIAALFNQSEAVRTGLSRIRRRGTLSKEDVLVVVVCGGSDVSAERVVGWREKLGGPEKAEGGVVAI